MYPNFIFSISCSRFILIPELQHLELQVRLFPCHQRLQPEVGDVVGEDLETHFQLLAERGEVRGAEGAIRPVAQKLPHGAAAPTRGLLQSGSSPLRVRGFESRPLRSFFSLPTVFIICDA